MVCMVVDSSGSRRPVKACRPALRRRAFRWGPIRGIFVPLGGAAGGWGHEEADGDAGERRNMRTLLEGGDIVAYHDGTHRLLRGGCLVVEDDRIVFVGRAFRGAVDRKVDTTGRLLIPG